MAQTTGTGYTLPLPRSTELRVTLTIAMALAPAVVTFIGAYIAMDQAMSRVDDDAYPTIAAYQDALIHRGEAVANVVAAIVIVLTTLAFTRIARKVSYRGRDCLLLLVPGYGTYLYFTFLWRLAYLPYRDWPLRPDEYESDELVSA